MLDIKLIREQPDFVKGELAKRGVEPAEVDRLLEADQKRRKLQAEVDHLRADRKRRSREVGQLPPEERAAEIAKIRAEEADEERLAKGEAIDASNPRLVLGAQLGLAEKNVEELALTLPNIPRPYVVVGASEADNRVIKTEGTPLEFTEDEIYATLRAGYEFVRDVRPLLMICHPPPFDTKCDRIMSGKPVGSTAARRFIEEVKPDVCISGHIHESAGVDRIGPTQIFNAGPFKGGGYIVIRAEGERLDARLEFL